MNRVILGALGFVLIAGGVLALVTGAVYFKNRREKPHSLSAAHFSKPASANEPVLTEFTLTERSGRRVASQELAGGVWVVSFFFGDCPQACRLQNGYVAELHSEFGPKGVTFVSITCDPEKDTPKRLREYAEMFNADPDQWLFLTGDLIYIRRIGAEMFKVPVDKKSHSEKLIVVDRQGETAGYFSWNDPKSLDEMREKLNDLLSATAESGAFYDTPDADTPDADTPDADTPDAS